MKETTINVQEYLSDLFGKLYAFSSNSGVRFSGNQLCEILGYAKERFGNTITKFVSEKDRETWVYKETPDGDAKSLIWSGNDYSDKWMITEPGVYSLILRSGMPKAEPLFDWVTHEVIPSIRENGIYVLGQENMKPDNKDAMIRMLNERLDEAEAEKSFATQQWEKYKELNKKHSEYLAEAEEKIEKLETEMSGRQEIAVCKIEVKSSRLDYYTDPEGFVHFYVGSKYNIPD